MTYGYCRISTKEQNIERQARNIKAAYPDAVIYEEAYTGTTLARPVWQKLQARLVAGDVVVFDSVSRMSRNAEEGFFLYRELYQAGVDLHFLKEPGVDTTTYKNAMTAAVPMTGTAVDCILKGINEYLLILAEQQILICFDQAQKEVDDLRQRTKEGMKTARLAGKQIGQEEGRKLNVKKAAAAKEIIKKHSKTFGGTLDDAEVIALCGISRNSYYKYKAELKSAE